MHSEPPVFVRGAYFRIFADGTLRGPDNDITATYADGIWKLANRQHRAFECDEQVYLRIVRGDGQRERIGPYDGIKVAEGAIFTHGSRLGMHASFHEPNDSAHLWREVAFLSN